MLLVLLIVARCRWRTHTERTARSSAATTAAGSPLLSLSPRTSSFYLFQFQLSFFASASVVCSLSLAVGSVGDDDHSARARTVARAKPPARPCRRTGNNWSSVTVSASSLLLELKFLFLFFKTSSSSDSECEDEDCFCVFVLAFESACGSESCSQARRSNRTSCRESVATDATSNSRCSSACPPALAQLDPESPFLAGAGSCAASRKRSTRRRTHARCAPFAPSRSRGVSLFAIASPVPVPVLAPE